MTKKEDQRRRAERMIDFGMEEAEVSYDLGGPVSEEEVYQVMVELGLGVMPRKDVNGQTLEKYHPSQPRVPSGSSQGGQWSGGTGGMGGIVGGKVKPYSKMTSEEIQGQLQGLADWNNKKKSRERGERKRLTDRYKEAKRKTNNLEKVGTKEDVKEAREKWFELCRRRGKDSPEAHAAYKQIGILSMPKDVEAHRRVRKIETRAGGRLAAFNDQARKWSPEKRALEILTLDKEDQANLDVSYQGLPKNRQGKVSKDVELFSSLVHKDAVGKNRKINFEETSAKRSSYDGYGTVRLSKNIRSKKTVVHELGHALEDANTLVRNKVHQFLDNHVQGMKSEKLGRGYEADERYKKRSDGKKWVDKYMGKIYSRGRATEITSMGLELYATKPLDFMKRDPEMFGLIASIARGEYKR